MKIVAALLFSVGLAAQQPALPQPVEGDFVIRDFRFASGETLPELKLHYRTLGTLRKDAQGRATNAVLIVHGTTGSGGQFSSRAFAGELFLPGQPLDITKYFIVMPDAIGHGASSKPSDGLRAAFPRYGYDDMVDAQHRLLTEGLGVNHARLVMGTSMGGMHTWVWGQRYPDFMDALLPLASLPDQISGRNRAWRRVLIDAIRNDPEWQGGNYTTRPQSMRTAAQMLWLVGSNPVLRQSAAPTLAATDKVLDAYVAGYRGDANDVLYAVEASHDYDPAPGLGKIRAPLVAINFADDLINPPELGILERGTARVANGRAITVPASDRTAGHGTHTLAAVWKHHLVDLLNASEKGGVAGVAAPPAQSSLSPQERAIVTSVDANQAKAIDLLERAVNINSGTMNLAGVRKAGDLFRAEFDALGFTTSWVDLAEVQRAGHLVAERTGRAGARKVLLIGHLDTVFEADSPFQAFERLAGNTARGPGVTDMKGGNVIILLALRALKDAGLLDTLHIVVVMTGDEESAGRPLRIARRALVDAAQGAVAAIGFEDGDGHPDHIVTARRGTTNWTLTVKGKPAHSSQIFRDDIGYGAIYEATRVLQEFRAQLAGQKHLTFNPGMILGGTSVEFDETASRGTAFGKANVIAEHAVVTGDIRALTPEQFETTQETMKKIASTPLGQTTSTLTFDEGYPPLAPTEGNARLLAILDRASRDLGLNPVVAVDPDRAGAADVSFIAAHVPMIIDAMGLKGDGGHTVDETGLLDTVAIQAKRAAVLLARLGSQRQ